MLWYGLVVHPHCQWSETMQVNDKVLHESLSFAVLVQLLIDFHLHSTTSSIHRLWAWLLPLTVEPPCSNAVSQCIGCLLSLLVYFQRISIFYVGQLSIDACPPPHSSLMIEAFVLCSFQLIGIILQQTVISNAENLFWSAFFIVQASAP